VTLGAPYDLARICVTSADHLMKVQIFVGMITEVLPSF
jgi:hypothetical protein